MVTSKAPSLRRLIARDFSRRRKTSSSAFTSARWASRLIRDTSLDPSYPLSRRSTRSNSEKASSIAARANSRSGWATVISTIVPMTIRLSLTTVYSPLQPENMVNTRQSIPTFTINIAFFMYPCPTLPWLPPVHPWLFPRRHPGRRTGAPAKLPQTLRPFKKALLS
jgi:hypothetical protein